MENTALARAFAEQTFLGDRGDVDAICAKDLTGREAPASDHAVAAHVE
jgi:hypothetical protein